MLCGTNFDGSNLCNCVRNVYDIAVRGTCLCGLVIGWSVVAGGAGDCPPKKPPASEWARRSASTLPLTSGSFPHASSRYRERSSCESRATASSKMAWMSGFSAAMRWSPFSSLLFSAPSARKSGHGWRRFSGKNYLDVELSSGRSRSKIQARA